MTFSDTVELRQSLINACLWMGQAGLTQGTSGNVSVRVGDALLITPSATPYDKMTPESICQVPLHGPPSRDDNPSTELPFHQALLNARPDMNAVVHAHPPYATAVAVQRRTIPPLHYMIAAFGGHDIPLAEYALFGTEQLSNNILAVMGDRHGCLIANHGALALGETLEKALWRMQELEMLARLLLITDTDPGPSLLTRQEINDVLTAFGDYGLKSGT